MHYLGFDVSRDKAEGVLVNRSCLIKERFSPPNTETDIIATLRPLQERGTKLTVGVEATGAFHIPVVAACTALSIPCKLINPIQSRQVQRGSVRKRKTDRDDALNIAKLLIQGGGRYVVLADVTDPLKVLVRCAAKVRSVMIILKQHVAYLEKMVGDAPVGLRVILGDLHALYATLQKDIVQKSDREKRELLQSIPGIGAWLASVILAEIGNPSRFRSGDSLVAFTGFDPKIRQSGTTQLYGRITKRGSPHLRWAIGCAAQISQRWDPEIGAFYRKKRAEGKRHRVALSATARKLCYRIHAVLKRGTPYVPAAK